MKYHKPFTFAERIQLLERSILVNSFAYYILDDNILSDFQYDDNAKELAELKKEHPEDFKRSRYYEYFKDYCSDDDTVWRRLERQTTIYILDSMKTLRWL